MMIETMRRLRRSPRTLLERDGHPGPGPGKLALVMARAGVGKTACLVGVGIDALLSGQNLLHISLHCTVEKVRAWYDDILRAMLRNEPELANDAELLLELERRRHIHTYLGSSFKLDKLRQALELLRETMAFVPRVIIFDQPDMEKLMLDTVVALKAIATEDRSAMLDRDLNIVLDPESLLLVTGVAPKSR
jgi:hypothetical protein